MAHVDLAGLWHEAAFRLTETYDVTVERGWRIALDQQPYGEVVHVVGGTCRFELGEAAVDVTAGEIGILLPGGRRVTQDVGGEALRFRGFGFRIERFGAVELTGLLRLPLRLSTPTHRQRDLVAAVVRHGADPTPAAALRARGLAELTVAQLVETAGSVADGQPTYRRPEIVAALDYLHVHLAEPIDIATLARAAHLSPKHFARCFRDEVGAPPMGYLKALRLSRARHGLATTDTALGAIAVEHGFADSAHFSRAFRRQYGMAPSAFRSRARVGVECRTPGQEPAPHGQRSRHRVGDDGGPTSQEAAMTTETTFTLTDEQVADFHAQGFLRLERLTSEAEVEALKGVYDRLFDGTTAVEERDRLELAGDPDAAPVLPQIVNPDRYAPELLETVACRNAHEIARRLLDDELESVGMHAIRKPPRSGGETPWHQDEAYWDPASEHEAISIWMPLQPATVENGCLQFVPGSHRMDVVEHRLINPESHGLVVSDESIVADAVACPLPPGGATVHASRTVHYAGPNGTDEPRRALIMAFARPTRPLETPRDFFWQRPEWTE